MFRRRRAATGQSFVVEERPEGRTLVVTDSWTNATRSAVLAGGVDWVWLNFARGFRERDLDFLDALPIRRLLLLAHTITDLSPLYGISDTLEALRLTAGYAATLDLVKLPNLASLSAYWPAVKATVAGGRSLQHLTVLEYTERDLMPFANNRGLQGLRIKDAPVLESLTGVEHLDGLAMLGVFAAPRLRDISQVGVLQGTLEDLRIEGSPGLDSIEDLEGLVRLRFLSISDLGDIESLRPIASFRVLEDFWAYGSTRVLDGNLEPLASLPQLQSIRMAVRPEYRPPLDAIRDPRTFRRR